MIILSRFYCSYTEVIKTDEMDIASVFSRLKSSTVSEKRKYALRTINFLILPLYINLNSACFNLYENE